MARNYWTEAEIDILRREYGITPTRQIAERLGRAVAAVQSKANKMGVYRDSRKNLYRGKLGSENERRA